MLRALIVASVLIGCRVHRSYECNVNADCGATARCEPTSFCSFPDPMCSSGFRYDEYAGGGLENRCVGDESDAGNGPTCPAGYTKIGGLASSYRVSTSNAQWLPAEMDCENDGPGTHLAVIDNAAENTALTSTLTGARFWFGLTDRTTENTWRTVTNNVQTYLPWEPQEPSGEDDCVAIRDGLISDEDCTDNRPFICECDGVAAVPAAYVQN